MLNVPLATRINVIKKNCLSNVWREWEKERETKKAATKYAFKVICIISARTCAYTLIIVFSIEKISFFSISYGFTESDHRHLKRCTKLKERSVRSVGYSFFSLQHLNYTFTVIDHENWYETIDWFWCTCNNCNISHETTIKLKFSFFQQVKKKKIPHYVVLSNRQMINMPRNIHLCLIK